MATRAYLLWNTGGRPYALMRPARDLQRILRGHGLTVYDYPDESHLKADTPEDHTPFSVTGWPIASAYGIGHALDVMPRADTAAGRAENAAIARRLIRDRNAGVPGVAWIKYINWTDEAGVCRQERWMPNHTTRSSTDKGHIHASGRSDCDNDTRAATYDPLGEGDDMAFMDDVNAAALAWRMDAIFADLPAVRGGPHLGLDAGRNRLFERQTAADARFAELAAEVRSIVDNGGGSVEVAAISAKLDAAVAEVNAETREVVASLGEGGAAKVRGQQ